MDLVDVLNNAKSWWNAPYKRESEGKKWKQLILIVHVC
jgi:hypothetical protein